MCGNGNNMLAQCWLGGVECVFEEGCPVHIPHSLQIPIECYGRNQIQACGADGGMV